MKFEDMVNNLRSYRNGVHGDFFLEVADKIEELTFLREKEAPLSGPSSEGLEGPTEERSNWISVRERLPKDGQRVISSYAGVYDYRIVTFWKDGGDNAHFGTSGDLDGKGSQPATHWMPLPESPKAT